MTEDRGQATETCCGSATPFCLNNISLLSSSKTTRPLAYQKNRQIHLSAFSVLCLLPSDSGGAREDRTPDLLRARQALSQLSYGPFNLIFFPLAALPSSLARSHTDVCSLAPSNGRLASEKNLCVKAPFREQSSNDSPQKIATPQSGSLISVLCLLSSVL